MIILHDTDGRVDSYIDYSGAVFIDRVHYDIECWESEGVARGYYPEPITIRYQRGLKRIYDPSI